MLYSYGRFLLPHLPLGHEAELVKLGDEIGLQYYRLQRVSSGEIDLGDGEPEGVRSPTDVGAGKAKDEEAPLSEIIKVLNERFATTFTEKDRLFFEQIWEQACQDAKVVQTAMVNPFDKFQLCVRQLDAQRPAQLPSNLGGIARF